MHLQNLHWRNENNIDGILNEDFSDFDAEFPFYFQVRLTETLTELTLHQTKCLFTGLRQRRQVSPNFPRGSMGCQECGHWRSESKNDEIPGQTPGRGHHRYTNLTRKGCEYYSGHSNLWPGRLFHYPAGVSPLYSCLRPLLPVLRDQLSRTYGRVPNSEL